MPRTWLLLFFVALAWSGIAPKDRITWWLEIAPALIALPILWTTRRRFPLTPLVIWLILAHAIILMIGGHYTYAEVPLFNGLFGWERNNFDKLGHFAQGFVPALVAREILLRNAIVVKTAWTNFISVCICMAISAFYELVEWWVALLSEEAADAFLGTQGYVWDTQSDMFWAMIGATCAVLLLGPLHDRQLRAITPS